MKKKRVVTEEQGRKFATDNGFTYFETSAKTGENVNEMFAFRMSSSSLHSFAVVNTSLWFHLLI
jgi:hypothetical protein